LPTEQFYTKLFVYNTVVLEPAGALPINAHEDFTSLSR